VSPETGERQDTAHTYLHPRLRDEKHKNLHVLIQSQVIRVLVDENKWASGVEIRTKPAFTPNALGLQRTIKARKLVVISAGALETPQILERSGIGGHEVLEKAGVPIISDLPGVGRNYQDHHMVVATYNSTLTPEQTVESVVNGVFNITELISSNAKILSWNGIDASFKLRPSDQDISDFKPELLKVWDADFENTPNRPLGSLGLVAG
jgi:alcohol oxidase